MDSPEHLALRTCGPLIIQSLYVPPVLDELYAKGWLTDGQCNAINEFSSMQDKSRKLLEFLRHIPARGIECFIEVLDEQQKYLSDHIRSSKNDQSVFSRSRAVSYLRDILINGNVPDDPNNFVKRRKLIEDLTGCLRDLAGRFRIPLALADGSVESPNSPPPNNAWLLIHGPPGCGKTVLCSSTLRHNPSLFFNCFLKGVIWLNVGPLVHAGAYSNSSEVSSHDTSSAINKNLISLLDDLQKRVALLHQNSAIDRGPPSQSLVESSARLRRTLIDYQKREFFVRDEQPALLLIVLDDVWDAEVGLALSPMPAAFVVTSRDMSVLDRVTGRVSQLHITNDLTNLEAYELLSTWSHPSIFGTDVERRQLVQLCRGSPFAVNLIGNAAVKGPHPLREYLCNPTGLESEFIDWSRLKWTSPYKYSSIHEALNQTLIRLGNIQAYFKQLVIFEAGVDLNFEMLGILWSIPVEQAIQLLDQFVRFSLAVKIQPYHFDYCCFHVHPLLLDALRSSVDKNEQIQLHAKFVQNYTSYCSGRWSQLVPQQKCSNKHIYFWHHATDHLFQASQFNRLVELLTDLEFLDRRLTVIDESLVIADFQRYKDVFVTLNKIDEWHAYMRFIQTNAYFLGNSNTQELTDRSRSPYRRGSRMYPDSSSPAYPSPLLRTDSPGLESMGAHANHLVHRVNRPKGLGLIQLGLGLSHDNPVFRYAVELIRKQYRNRGELDVTAKGRVPAEYYWFWCNSHVAASELIWAISTSSQGVSCLAVEHVTCPDLHGTEDVPSDVSESIQVPNSGLKTVMGNQGRFRKRYLAATVDGRVLLLDANSGYEVASQQIYSKEVGVKLLSFISNNTECLTCGLDGAFVVSRLPEADPSTRDLDSCVENMCSMYRAQSPNNYPSDHMGGLDVDDEDENEWTIPSSTTAGTAFFPDDADTEVRDTVTNGLNQLNISSRHMSLADSPTIKVPSPTVLAELPRLSVLARVDGSSNVSDRSVSKQDNGKPAFVLHSISASSKLDVVLICGDGQLNLNVLRADGPTQDQQPQPSVVMPSLYYLKRNGNDLYLDLSRSLRLPPLSSWLVSANVDQSSPVFTAISAISADSQYLAVGLSDGFIWLYSLERIGWVCCISTYVAQLWNKITEDSPVRSSVTSQELVLQSIQAGIKSGSVPSSCLFLPSLSTNKEVRTDSDHIDNMFAAAIGSSVFVWSVPETVCFSESRMTEQDQLVIQSRPALCLQCSYTCSVLTLDACRIADELVLAGGTTNGRVLLWRIRDGCRLLDLSVHPSSVTTIRLLPADVSSSGECDEDYLDISNMPIGLLTASADGVIKRWEVGAACLPSPSTPTPHGGLTLVNALLRRFSQQSACSCGSCDRPTALHGLWTDVFDVWFGPNALLLIAGLRRHSSDLQFLFRPQQQTREATIRCEAASKFQEIAIKPSNPFYWRKIDHCTVVPTSRKTSSEQSHAVHSKKCTRTTPEPGMATRKTSRHTMPPTRHWIATTGLSGTIRGRATTVSFWSSGRWVAVGFSTGLIQVYSLHFDDSQLYGIVKRFCLITEAGDTRHPTILDRVIHLHTWQSDVSVSDDDQSACLTLVVLAVFASGTVRYWHMPFVSHDVPGGDTSYLEVRPSESWPPKHERSLVPHSEQQLQRSSRKISTSELQSSLLCDSSETDESVPVTWSALRSISVQSATASHSASVNWLGSTQSTHAKTKTILVWLTTGFDGMVYGRQLLLPASKTPTIPEDRSISQSTTSIDSNRNSPTWHLDLAAHKPEAITDADVDPSGQWLLTGSTDATAKVWCLSTGSLVFNTGVHEDCVRSVCFRPVIDEPFDTYCREWYIATGDDTGTLRVWPLSAKTLHQIATSKKYGTLNRSISPEDIIYSRFNANPSTFNSSVPHVNRVPSPDSIDGVRPARPLKANFCSKPGGTWLKRLVWSPDGRLITGLSDRLCVWPFERPTPRMAQSGDFNKAHRSPLGRCRVLRVLSSGVSERLISSPHLLSVSPRRQCTSTANNQTPLFGALTDLPPTIVTVDVNTGTLYVFDPIGALFQSELGK